MADRRANHYMVTLAVLGSAEQVTFWLSGKSEAVAAAKAQRRWGEASNVVDIVPCDGSPAKKSAAPSASL